MVRIQRILFPTDFSEAATRAFPQAVFLADWHDAELHIVNVTEPRISTDKKPKAVLPVSLETLLKWFGHSSKTAVRRLEGLPIVQKQIEDGAPAEQIVAYTETEDIDLVVMGTHGHRGVRRMLLGSVAEEVLRKTACPVLTQRSDVDEAPREAVRRVLVPIDFSDASDVALQHAKEIAQTYGAQLDLLHVVEEVGYPSVYGIKENLLPEETVVTSVEKTLAEMAREEIGYEHVQIAVQVGYAPLTILDYIEQNDVDLLVIPTHGRSGLDRVLLGSVTERILRQSPVPVFAVKPEGRLLVPANEPTSAAAGLN